MKKIIALLASLTLCISMCTGCGDSDSSSGTNSDSKVSTESGDTSGEESAADDSDGGKALYVSPYTEQQEMRDISAWELVKEIKTGWNLGNTLDAIGNNTVEAETYWQKDITTKSMIDFLADGGFDLIRIPVSWGEHMDEDYNVDPEWMARVHEIVDYAVDNDMYIILNTHHEEWYFPTAENKEQDIEQLTALWSQIAEEFKNYDEHLIFEGLNEPRLRGTASEWTGGTKASRDIVNEYEQAFYNTVRASGGNNDKRMLMLTGYAASSQRNCLSAIWIPEDDDRIIISVHGYIPYSFALDTKGTDQFDDSNKGQIDSFFGDLAQLFYVNEIPVIVGEYGSVNKFNDEERVEWVTYYLEAAKQLGYPCVWWDNNAVAGNGENFGILGRSQPHEWRFPELVDAIMAVYDE